jgi:hypothetical protein
MSDLFQRLIAKKAEAEQKALIQSIMSRYTAIYIGGTMHPVPRSIGDNMLGWPLTFGHTQSWKDHITGGIDRGAPYHWQGVLFRLWHLRTDAKEVDRLVLGYFHSNYEHLKKEWWEAGPSVDIPMLMADLMALLFDNGVMVMDDERVQIHWAEVAVKVRGGKIGKAI